METGVAGIPTAFCASYGSGAPVIGLLAEYDALEGMSQAAEATTRQPVVKGPPATAAATICWVSAPWARPWPCGTI